MSVYSATEVITPAMASDLLGRNTVNRQPIERHVEHLSRQMSEGYWRDNGQPIILSESGTVLDGQHRLMAVVKSGRPARFLVVRGVGSDVMDTIDTGRSRQAKDVLSMHGHTDAAALAAAARVCWHYDRFGTLMARSRAAPSSAELAAYIDQHPDLVDMVKLCYPIKRLVGNARTAGVLALVARRHGRKAAESCVVAMTGVGLTETDAIWHLRRRIESGSPIPADYRGLLLMAKAFLLHITNTPCRSLRVAEKEDVVI